MRVAASASTQGPPLPGVPSAADVPPWRWVAHVFLPQPGNMRVGNEEKNRGVSGKAKRETRLPRHDQQALGRQGHPPTLEAVAGGDEDARALEPLWAVRGSEPGGGPSTWRPIWDRSQPARGSREPSPDEVDDEHGSRSEEGTL